MTTPFATSTLGDCNLDLVFDSRYSATIHGDWKMYLTNVYLGDCCAVVYSLYQSQILNHDDCMGPFTYKRKMPTIK